MSQQIAIGLGFFFIAIISIVSVVSFSVLERSEKVGGAELNSTLSRTASMVSIEIVMRDSVIVRNIGTAVIDTSSITVYVDSYAKECEWNFANIQPGTSAICTAEINCAEDVKAVSPGNTDVKPCSF